MPGLGSLMAGRVSGYAQFVLGVGGMILSVISGTRFILWFLANWSRLQSPDADPFTTLAEMWTALRWPLLGLGVFCAAWLWSLSTSLSLLREARATESKSPPPL
jgi:hypothetical protein